MVKKVGGQRRAVCQFKKIEKSPDIAPEIIATKLKIIIIIELIICSLLLLARQLGMQS
jgi:hypothetical protein